MRKVIVISRSSRRVFLELRIGNRLGFSDESRASVPIRIQADLRSSYYPVVPLQNRVTILQSPPLREAHSLSARSGRSSAA